MRTTIILFVEVTGQGTRLASSLRSALGPPRTSLGSVRTSRPRSRTLGTFPSTGPRTRSRCTGPFCSPPISPVSGLGIYPLISSDPIGLDISMNPISSGLMPSSPGMAFPEMPSASLLPTAGIPPPLTPMLPTGISSHLVITSVCALRKNGTCYGYLHVMNGGCRGANQRYTWDHCPRYQMCCYTEQTSQIDPAGPGTGPSGPIPDPSFPGPGVETGQTLPGLSAGTGRAFPGPDPTARAVPAPSGGVSSGGGGGGDCVYNGVSQSSGATFPDMDGCNTCQCTILGVMCTSNTC